MSSKHLKIDVETHETLTFLSQASKLSMKDIVAFFVKLGSKYHMLEPDWKDRLAEDLLSEYKKKLEIRFSQTFEKEKMKWKLKAKHGLLMKYVDTLDPDERKTFIEGLMVDINNPDFLDKIAEMEMVLIDGKRRLVRLEEGLPMIGVEPENLLMCEVGWHIKGRFCECKRWRECNLRSEEYLDYKARAIQRTW